MKEYLFLNGSIFLGGLNPHEKVAALCTVFVSAEPTVANLVALYKELCSCFGVFGTLVAVNVEAASIVLLAIAGSSSSLPTLEIESAANCCSNDTGFLSSVRKGFLTNLDGDETAGFLNGLIVKLASWLSSKDSVRATGVVVDLKNGFVGDVLCPMSGRGG